jgi:SAM-dependent methyltransferase
VSVPCPVCAEAKNSLVEKLDCDYSLYHCGVCDVVFAEPMKTDMAFYEKSEDYLFRDRLIFDPMQWDFRWDMLQFLKYQPLKGKRLLDVGCGTGFFVKKASDIGYDAYGIELNKRSVESGKRHFNISTLYATDLSGFLTTFPSLKFDVVTLFQVLEHVEDPARIILEIKQIINKDAVIIIALPLRERWPDISGEGGDSPPHHLTKWSLRAMEYFLNKAGFNINRTVIEDFPLRNMSYFMYNYILKLLPSLTMKGQGIGSYADGITVEEATAILKRRKTKILLATAVSFPLWFILKLLGAKGPNLYIEASLKP